MWPPEALEFLRELEDNNDTAWLRDNRRRYDELLVAPTTSSSRSTGSSSAPGLHHPAPDQLERFRAAIDNPRPAASFERAVEQAEQAGLALAEPALKRAPRGYPNDHPRVDRLRLKSVTVSRRHQLEPWLHEPRCRQVVRSELEAAAPLVRWPAATVGPSTLPRRDR